jgi:WD40 repeat protein
METKTEKTPQDIVSSGEQIFDIDFHPQDNFIAIGSITGLVEVVKYGQDKYENYNVVNKMNYHKSSCRGVLFSSDGSSLITISSDLSWKSIDGTGSILLEYENAHSEPINKITNISDMPRCFVTGDDSGVVKVWDSRLATSEVLKWKGHEDFISDLFYVDSTNTLFSTSGDSTLCVYDIRNNNKFERSDEQESELNCIQSIKHNRKLICGSQEGVIVIFSWGKWGDCLDRYPGHPETLDCMVKIDESTILTGSSDGLIRVVAIQPNKILGVVGDHDQFPVEGMCRNHTERILASYAHDNLVRFWDVSMFVDDAENGKDGEDEVQDCVDNIDVDDGEKTNLKRGHLEVEDENENEMQEYISAEDQDIDDEDDWEDMDTESDQYQDDEEDDDDNDDHDDSSDDKDNKKNNNSNKMFKTPNENFFADL